MNSTALSSSHHRDLFGCCLWKVALQLECYCSAISGCQRFGEVKGKWAIDYWVVTKSAKLSLCFLYVFVCTMIKFGHLRWKIYSACRWRPVIHWFPQNITFFSERISALMILYVDQLGQSDIPMIDYEIKSLYGVCWQCEGITFIFKIKECILT